MRDPNFIKIIDQFKEDKESVYHSWFLNSKDRLKAFRTIKKGLSVVINEIENNEFGNDFKGSSLEVVVTAISEQKQVFEGASHAFYWKPKLRIPDIYENGVHKKAFGRFLKACLQTNNEDQIILEIKKLDNMKIKGLGPAVANILYFLHPTLFPPFNTAILNGFNLLYNQKKKLGSWEAYLEIRERILAENEVYKDSLSKDLGAIAGLLFEIGTYRLIIEENADISLIITEKKNKSKNKRHKQIELDDAEEITHSEMQYYLAKLGNSLGYKVWIARNDHKRVWEGIKLGEYSIPDLKLSNIPADVYDTVSLIDVLWINENHQIVCGFEVEKSTSIYSGILRLHDLCLSIATEPSSFYLVAPEKREKEIKAQLLRPSFRNLESFELSYLLFKDLRCDCDAMCKFGDDLTVLEKISKSV
ncbi:hypothetical protein ACQKJG_23320 [Priestia megaterium]|uniref:hypothetical protein n=1 Tax=Priestia TaxID=2800373 RepID=UPI001C8CFF0B|nr:hypothetical protein [Priestia aryabhattai]MBY0029788.1 hypothetical protein [Priestia aryabhattai]